MSPDEKILVEERRHSQCYTIKRSPSVLILISVAYHRSMQWNRKITHYWRDSIWHSNFSQSFLEKIFYKVLEEFLQLFLFELLSRKFSINSSRFLRGFYRTLEEKSLINLFKSGFRNFLSWFIYFSSSSFSRNLHIIYSRVALGIVFLISHNFLQ